MRLLIGDVVSAQGATELCSRALNVGQTAAAGVTAAVLAALREQPLFMLATQPVAFSEVTLARHSAERATDSPRELPVSSSSLRVDLVAVLFLSPPESYQGGELLLDTGFGAERYRPEVGTCLAFPASARYEIAPVTRGSSWLASVAVQSGIRSASEREILYDVGYALHLLDLFGPEHTHHADRLRRCQSDLLRSWLET
jgi:PKHD-type hydroxylase